ncbi:MAG: hypothetical protein JXB29_02070 [Sedimentisphaerales bacterium]|nr:hypothetical protein [Sedimentisphaerales bacterium]
MKCKKLYIPSVAVCMFFCLAGYCKELPEGLTNEMALIGQANPALVGIEQLFVHIIRPESEPNENSQFWKELEARVIDKLKEAGIKTAPGIAGNILNIPELRIHIELLKLDDLQQYIFHIQTSLMVKVSLVRSPARYIKADVWQTSPVMYAVALQEMQAEVTDFVLGQIDAFIHAYIAANPKAAGRAAQNNTGVSLITLPKGQAKPADRADAAKNRYVASKNSKVFHRSDCPWAKKIKPENMIGYENRRQAISAGKRPCKRCKP